MDETLYSQESSEYELNADTLDQLYKEQLQMLRDLIFKQNHTNDIELCHKWLKVFSKTSKSEKMARNCLCALMQQQLQECGFLGAPFTNLQNCNRDLDHVLHDLDEPCSMSEYCDSDAFQTFASHNNRQQMRCTTIHDAALTECHENETNAENVVLRHELATVRLQLTEKQIENIKLKELLENYDMEKLQCAQTIVHFKTQLLENIQRSMREFQSDKHGSFKVFERIFGFLAHDEAFSVKIKDFDESFQRYLNQLFKKELSKRKALIARHIYRKFSKVKLKMNQKFEKRLKVQNVALSLQLKLDKLKCFSVLRNIFINMQDDGNKQENMWHLLKVLEENYQSVVNEIS